MNKRKLLVEMAKQFYEDCRHIAETNSTQPLDEEGCVMFNSLLREMMGTFPECALFASFREMPARSVKFKEAVLVAGQLYRIASLLDESPAAAGAAQVAAAPPVDGRRPVTREVVPTAAQRQRPMTEQQAPGSARPATTGSVATGTGGPPGRPGPGGPQTTPADRMSPPGGARPAPGPPPKAAPGPGGPGMAAASPRPGGPPAGAPAPARPPASEKTTQKIASEAPGPAKVEHYGPPFKE